MTIRPSFFKKFAILLFAIFIVNAFANFFYWYQSFFWFDMMMHFMGGIAGGLFLVWLFYKKYLVWRSRKKYLRIIILTSALFLLAAILWEVMEFSVQDFFDIGDAMATLPDSWSDLFFGLMGNFVALAYFFIKYQNNKLVLEKRYESN